MTFDPRLTPARDDLAADFLRGIVTADTFAKGSEKRVVSARCPLRGRPDEAAWLSTELLFGESFVVYEERAGWAWGQSGRDDYVGYVPSDQLGEPGGKPTHQVGVLRTFIYPEPNLKSPTDNALSLGSLAMVSGSDGDFAEIEGSGYVFSAHLVPVEAMEADYLTTAIRFIGVPYLWGGRSSLGLDCSGLIQIVLQRAGLSCPRDSDMQAKSLGEQIEPDLAALQRGDLAFFPGHVGLMVDEQTLLHANAWDMMVSPHPLRYVIAEIGKKEAEPLTCIRRFSESAG